MATVHSLSPQEVYGRVVTDIIRTLEAGQTGPFELPWHQQASTGLPKNIRTGNYYQGINTLILWGAAQDRAYPTPCWATYRQWAELGAQVLRGELSAPILFYKPLTPSSEQEDEDEAKPSRAVLRLSHVFNAAQVDGWAAPVASQAIWHERVEKYVEAVGASIIYGGDRAYYTPTYDCIHMPPRERFVGTKTSTPVEGFYSTLLHEHIHWTAHPSRLQRDLTGRFGSNGYAFEELVAELGAAFLCAELGVADVPRKDHAQYLQGWLHVLTEKKEALGLAASLAAKACQHLGDLTRR